MSLSTAALALVQSSYAFAPVGTMPSRSMVRMQETPAIEIEEPPAPPPLPKIKVRTRTALSPAKPPGRAACLTFLCMRGH